jgi:DNA repair exonuclease SbcCD ATPase subunit
MKNPQTETKIPVFGRKDLILTLQAANNELRAKLEELERQNAELSKKLTIHDHELYDANKRIKELEALNARQKEHIDSQTAEIKKMGEESRDKDNILRRKNNRLKENIGKLREKSAVINSQGERLQETDENYYWDGQAGIDYGKTRFEALGIAMNKVYEYLAKRGDVVNLTEVKNGDFITDTDPRAGQTHIYFKGSTPPKIWNELLEKKNYGYYDAFNGFFDRNLINLKNEDHNPNDPEITQAKKEQKKFLPDYGHILDTARFKHEENEYLFYDGAHLFMLYHENYDKINVENLVKSYLREYGLDLANGLGKYNINITFERHRPEKNNFNEIMEKEKNRVATKMGTVSANSR